MHTSNKVWASPLTSLALAPRGFNLKTCKHFKTWRWDFLQVSIIKSSWNFVKIWLVYMHMRRINVVNAKSVLFCFSFSSASNVCVKMFKMSMIQNINWCNIYICRIILTKLAIFEICTWILHPYLQIVRLHNLFW